MTPTEGTNSVAGVVGVRMTTSPVILRCKHRCIPPGRHVADARLHRHARTPFHDLERAVFVQPLGERCNKGRRHMLHQENAGRNIRWNQRQHVLQCRRSPGGDSDGDRLLSGDVLKRGAHWRHGRACGVHGCAARRSRMPREAAALSFEISSSATDAHVG